MRFSDRLTPLGLTKPTARATPTVPPALAPARAAPAFAALALCLLVLLTACQPLPRPFQPEDKQVSAAHLRALVANSLFIVEPLQDAAEPLASMFAESLAAELQRREVPATARRLADDPLAQAILAVLVAYPPPDRIGVLRIDYLLVEADGHTRPVASDELSVAGDAFADGAPDLLSSLAERGARRLTDAVFRPGPGMATGRPASPAPGPDAEAPARPATDPSLAASAATEFFVFDVSGAPGDGNAALLQAMRRILRASGVPLTAEMTADAYVLAGAVAMAESGRQQEQVSIDWTLFAPDGDEIGTVTVENVVPAGSLDGRWGPIAEAASAGSAEGMLQLISAVMASAAAGPPDP